MSLSDKELPYGLYRKKDVKQAIQELKELNRLDWDRYMRSEIVFDEFMRRCVIVNPLKAFGKELCEVKK